MAASRPPSLLALRAFEAAARRLSFTDAAHELHVSQAAISRHVRGLERDLAVPLFRRLHQRVALTPAGKQLAARLAVGFEHLRGAVDAVKNHPARELRVTAEPAFAALWLVPRLGEFSAAYPDIEINLETSLELRALGREADIAIRYVHGKAPASWRLKRRLLDVDGVPVIAGSRKARDLPDDRSVLGLRLLHDDGGSGWRRWFQAAGMPGYPRAKHLHFSDHALALEAARAGQGVALATPLLIQHELRCGALQIIGKTRIPFGEYWLLQSSERSTAKLRTAFAQWIEEHLPPSGWAPSP